MHYVKKAASRGLAGAVRGFTQAIDTQVANPENARLICRRGTQAANGGRL